MEHTAIIQKVREILNEQGGADGLIIGTDLVSLDDYIESAIPDAVVMLAQKGYRVNVKTISKEDRGTLDETGDFISLIEARCKEWNRVIYRLTPTDSPEFAMAQNEYTKPGPNSPIAWWINGTGGPGLDFAPWEEKYPVYITYNGVYNSSEGLKAEPKEATAVCYMTAALVMGIYGDDNSKQRFSDLAVNMLQ